MRSICAALVLLALVAPAGAGDSWAPYHDFATASEDGRAYVIVRCNASFEIYARREGGPPYRPPEQTKERRFELDSPPVLPDAGDRRLAGGTLPQLPFRVFVAGDGAFVAFEKFPHIGYG